MKTAIDYRHAIRRACERYGVCFTAEQLEAFSLRVRMKDALHLMTETRTRTHWLIDDQYIVVYNKNLKAITTFLPPECIFYYLPGRGDGNESFAPTQPD